jgi:HAD superfamily hydrolase (TIGR01509 family)
MVDGIVFDLDDTLIDSEMLIESIEYGLFTANGADISASERPGSEIFRSLSFPELFERFIGRDENLLKKLSSERSDRIAEEIPKIEFFPESIEVLKTLKNSGLKLSVGTGNSRSVFNLMDDQLHITDLVDAVVCRDDVKNGKPAPDTFLKALEEIKVAPVAAIVVGDSASDIEAGNAMHAKTVQIVRQAHADYQAKRGNAVLPGAFATTEMEGVTSKADYTIRNLRELLEEPFTSLFKV